LCFFTVFITPFLWQFADFFLMLSAYFAIRENIVIFHSKKG